MRDELGDRMKTQYENRTRCSLPRRTFTIIRADGRAFHNYTRGLERPFDAALMADTDATAAHLCANIEGCAFGYVQSDEISLLLTDFGNRQTEAWFDGNLQKITSIAASLATAAFNQARWKRHLRARLTEIETDGASESGRADAGPRSVETMLLSSLACFDARAFTIPDPTEVENYFIWRQQDATRNSISMAAQSVCAHAELQGKSADEMQEVLWQKGINWNDYPPGFKRGRCIVRKARRETVTFTHRKTGEIETVEAERHRWEAEAPPIFTRERAYLAALIPKYA